MSLLEEQEKMVVITLQEDIQNHKSMTNVLSTSLEDTENHEPSMYTFATKLVESGAVLNKYFRDVVMCKKEQQHLRFLDDCFQDGDNEIPVTATACCVSSAAIYWLCTGHYLHSFAVSNCCTKSPLFDHQRFLDTSPEPPYIARIYNPDFPEHTVHDMIILSEAMVLKIQGHTDAKHDLVPIVIASFENQA